MNDSPNQRGGTGRLRSSVCYDYVRDELLSGSFQPGQRIDVNAIAETLKVSRYPVLEALKRLASENLVEILPQVGCVVISPSPEEIRSHFLFLAQSSQFFARLAAARISPNEVTRLRDLSEKMRAVSKRKKIKASDAKEFQQLNREFHAIVYRAANTPRLTSMIATLWDLNDFYIVVFGSKDFSVARMSQACDEHDRFVSALAAGNADLAGTVAFDHSVNVADGIGQFQGESTGKKSK